MKKYFVISFLFLLAVTPSLAKGSTNAQGQQGQTTVSSQSNTSTTTSPTKNPVASPTGNQVKNKNEIQTKNQGEEQQLIVKTEEKDQNIEDNFSKVSDQVHQLIDTVGAKGGIGQQVKEIAQNQNKNQENIKNDLAQLQLRKSFVKFFLGSDKKIIENINQELEQNSLVIKQLEELKTQTKNSANLTQIQETIDLITYQNNSLQEKIDQEKQSNGIFGWLSKLFSNQQ